MLPHSGSGSRTFREVADLGRETGLLSPVAGTTARAEIAVLFDWNGWWGLEEVAGLPRNDFSYTDTVMRHYRPLWEHHHAVDVVSPHGDLAPYKVLIVPNAYLIDDRGVEAVTEFARSGGTVVVSFFSGVVDECNRVRPDGYPGAFRHLIGARIDEYWPARPEERFTVRFAGGHTATADWWREDIHLETGTALATYADGLLEGRAAIVVNDYGSGRVVYFSTLLEEAAFGAVLLGQVEEAGVRSRFGDVPAHVECSVREDTGHEYFFLLNHDAERTAAVRLPGGGRDLLTGTPVGEEVTLPPLGAAVVQREL
ncbi:beta-galactosidase [Streptosporangium sp. G11]|uniref:beta-galactosidase n=1 Tax=Streptosporangium sp. G11 TaxID=3436926 RepID=UPI003EBF2D24